MIDSKAGINNITIYQPFSLRIFLLVILKRKKLILTVFISTLATVAILTFIQTPTYISSAKILVEPEKFSDSMVLFNINAPSKYSNLNWINSEIDILKSRPVAERVVEEFNLEKTDDKNSDISPAEKRERKEIAIEDFQETLEIESSQNSYVIQIIYENQNPVIAASVVNGVIDHYRKYRLEIFDESGNYQFYEDQLTIVGNKLQDLENKEAAYKYDEDIILPNEQANVILVKLTDYEKSLTSVRTRIISKQAKLNIIKEQLQKGSDINIPSTEVSDSPSREKYIATLKSQLLTMEIEHDQLLQRFKPTYEKVVELYRKIEKTKEIIKNEIDEIIEQEQTSIKALQAEKQALEQLIDKISLEMKEFARKDFQITQLSRGIKDNRELYSLLLKQREDARLSIAKLNSGIDLKVINPAVVPRKPATPRKLFNMVFGAVLGLMGGLSLAFILNYFDQTVNTERELKQITGLTVLGSVKDFREESKSL